MILWEVVTLWDNKKWGFGTIQEAMNFYNDLKENGEPVTFPKFIGWKKATWLGGFFIVLPQIKNKFSKNENLFLFFVNIRFKIVNVRTSNYIWMKGGGNVSIQEKLKNYIEHNGLKVRSLAVKAGIPERRLYRVVNGETKLLADDFEKLCKKALEVDPKIFL